MNAPIVVFVYNRLDHTKNVLKSISECPESIESDIYIFSDGPKNEGAVDKVKAVRNYIHDEELKRKFRKVNIIESKRNKGLANSVISGVTQVISQYGQAIVVEDDNIVDPDFLFFMNQCLDFYRMNPKVWAIGGYTLPIHFPDDYHHDIYFMDRGSSYAWATWENRWKSIDWEIKDYPKFKKDKYARKAFNQAGEDRSNMLDSQMKGKIDSWAIRFTYNAFKNNMLFVLPRKSYVKNTGNDGSGIHVAKFDQRFDVVLEEKSRNLCLENLEIDTRIQKETARIFQTPLKIKIKRKIKQLLERN